MLCVFLDFLRLRYGGLLRDGQQPPQAAAAIPHRQGQILRLLQFAENADSGGKSKIDAAFLRAAGQLPRDLSRCTVRKDAAFIHGHYPVGGREYLVQPVFRHEDGNTQLAVDPLDGGKQVAGGQRVQHGGGFVQDQQLRTHGQRRGQIHQLLLTAGQLRGLAAEPCLHAEKGGHLRHTAADHGDGQGHILKAKSQLMPHEIGDDLVIRILLYKADLRRSGQLRQLGERFFLIKGLAGLCPNRQQAGLGMTQQCGLATAGGAAQHHILAFLYLQRHFVQRPRFGQRVGEAQLVKP